MVDSADLIRKVRFPRQLVAFSVVATQAVTFAVMLVILIVLSLVFVPGGARDRLARDPARRRSSPALVAGVALIVACLNVVFRDIEHILTAALLPWFFLTPILWSFADLPARGQRHHKLIEVLRWGNFVAPPIAARARRALARACPAAGGRDLPRGRGRRSRSRSASFVFSRVDDRLAIEL